MSVPYRFHHHFFLLISLTWATTQAIGQATVRLLPEGPGGAYLLSAANLPNTGVAVVWQSTGCWAVSVWSSPRRLPKRKIDRDITPAT